MADSDSGENQILADLHAQIDRMKEDQASDHSRIHLAEQTTRQLIDSLKKQIADDRDERSKADSLESEIKSLKQQLQDAQTKIQEQEGELTDLKATKETEMQDLTKQYDEQIQEKDDQLQTLQDSMSELQEKHESAKAAHEELESKMASLLLENESLKQQVAEGNDDGSGKDGDGDDVE